MLPRFPINTVCFESVGRASYKLIKISHRDFGKIRAKRKTQEVVEWELERVSALFLDPETEKEGCP